ncbi:MAG: bifunctional 23S rRNA (guanine(2069)-N(7))-methyltransferase RlmK/23S rRNA (guanine(2445)-N(2))-methyltransferase RlmL [Magnetococcales bacterium]|nr:bifunctional 23S rRNA (guanine(2069)-N(7))-methyltransferase RlmK/23S rRNA (guanine(2445)-N(2))-methyltransferase RlmL [Magnetococcales bacterium]
MLASYPLFATAARGVEALLAQELRDMGAKRVREVRAGVSFHGDFRLAARVCLWSRVASRLILPLAQVQAPDPEALYQGVRDIPWENHLPREATLAVSFTGTHTTIRHTHFGALKVKDGVVDRLREVWGVRPDVNLDAPDLLINVRLRENTAHVGIDLSGESLHRRGYRSAQTTAPLKESLAAAILLLAGWPEVAQEGGALLDPMCGSGTLLIEGAWMAADMAPGLLRERFGFMGWLGQDPEVWRELLDEAHERAQEGLKTLPPVIGYDRDSRAIKAARENIIRAGLVEKVRVSSAEVGELTLPGPDELPPGVMVTNPPYGTRQGEEVNLHPLYQTLGEVIQSRLQGWKGAVFTARGKLEEALGLPPKRPILLYNGALPCHLLPFDSYVKRDKKEKAKGEWSKGKLLRHPGESGRRQGGQDPSLPKGGRREERGGREFAPPKDIGEGRDQELDGPRITPGPHNQMGPGGEMLFNRLIKNLKRLKSWINREEIRCFRLYDADIPEFAVAIDVYEEWVHVQEYSPPAHIDPQKARERLETVLAVIPEALDLPWNHIFLKVRKRRQGGTGHNIKPHAGRFHKVSEGGLQFRVNFTDHLDTGLFLDHAPTRRMLGKMAGEKRFLNLFGHTGAATVAAAAGGALETVTVDLSNTYLDWAKKNMALNGFKGPEHQFIRKDCLAWLKAQQRLSGKSKRFGLIFLDPPTFSNSKSLDAPFDLQKSHVSLISLAASLLDHGGVLVFSNNLRRFRMDRDALPKHLEVTDITRETLAPDFQRNARIHNCWRIRYQKSLGGNSSLSDKN